MLHSLFDRTTRTIEIVLAAAFMAAVCMNFVNVTARYLFSVAFGWVDEVQVFIMVWMAFLGAVVATWRGAHLRMDMLLKLMPLGLQKAVRFAELLVMVVASGLVVKESWHYAATMYSLDRVSDVGRIPMWIPHGGVALGFALVGVIALAQLADVARGVGEGARRPPIKGQA